MGSYIPTVATLLRQVRDVILPAEQQIQAAIRALRQNPVAGYDPFTEPEVRLLAAYRAFAASMGGYEVIWPIIANGEPLAWVFAVHEAAELQAFADLGANPFDLAQFRAYLQETHLRAMRYELQYLKDWAEQLGWKTSEVALEKENPVRQRSLDHARTISLLQAREGWGDSTVEEEEQARAFWERIRKG